GAGRRLGRRRSGRLRQRRATAARHARRGHADQPVRDQMMTRRERVQAALRGEPVDRVPISFWLHNFATENSADGLATETLRLARVFGWDFLQPQSRAQCFAERWGLTSGPSPERAPRFATTPRPLSTAAAVARLRPVDPRHGALGEQLAALATIRAGVGRDTPIIWTVFAPMMVMPYLLTGGRAQALALARTEPKAMDAGLAAIAETLTAYPRACVEAGAGGVFFATNVPQRGSLTAGEGQAFHTPPPHPH